MFNPLYVHAQVGLGKTHLLQAITWAGHAAERRMLYLTAERFVFGFVSSLRTQTTLAFKELLRSTDVLLIDDLQFLQGKSTHAEFSHTLNAMIDAGRQVVVAADRPPLDLENLDERVRSRLAGGLVVEMSLVHVLEVVDLHCDAPFALPIGGHKAVDQDVGYAELLKVNQDRRYRFQRALLLRFKHHVASAQHRGVRATRDLTAQPVLTNAPSGREITMISGASSMC